MLDTKNLKSLQDRIDNSNINRNYIQRFIPFRQQIKQPKLNNEENKNHIIGLILFFIIFILIIPYFLYNLNLITILLVYLLNIDNIATILSNHDGPFKNYFKYLYTDSTPLIGYISQTLISIIVLGALFFVVFVQGKNKTIGTCLARFLISLLITFFLPNRYITTMMYYADNFIKNNLKMINNISLYVTFIIGVITVILFILAETFLLKNYSGILGKILDKFFKDTNILEKIQKNVKE